jgi:hypothetical protein
MMTTKFMKFTCICYKLNLYNLQTHKSINCPLQKFLFFYQSICIFRENFPVKLSLPFSNISTNLTILKL